MKRVENLKSSSNLSSSSVFSMQKGKIPPQAVDLEEVVLGAMMIDKKGVDEVIDILQPRNIKTTCPRSYKTLCQNLA